MIQYLKDLAEEQIQRIRASGSADLLSDKAAASLTESLEEVIETVARSTMSKLIANEITPTNPLAAINLDLTLKEERENAEAAINERLASGEAALPLPLTEILRTRLTAVGDAVIEMTERMSAKRDDICAALTGGKKYTVIEDIILSAGDTQSRTFRDDTAHRRGKACI